MREFDKKKVTVNRIKGFEDDKKNNSNKLINSWIILARELAPPHLC